MILNDLARDEQPPPGCHPAPFDSKSRFEDVAQALGLNPGARIRYLYANRSLPAACLDTNLAPALERRGGITQNVGENLAQASRVCHHARQVVGIVSQHGDPFVPGPGKHSNGVLEKLSDIDGTVFGPVDVGEPTEAIDHTGYPFQRHPRSPGRVRRLTHQALYSLRVFAVLLESG